MNDLNFIKKKKTRKSKAERFIAELSMFEDLSD